MKRNAIGGKSSHNFKNNNISTTETGKYVKLECREEKLNGHIYNSVDFTHAEIYSHTTG